ncbi:translin-associated factor X-interacting protein 1 isoform X1 [Egretta garzetta]|uniref:translin-associated factor X-interacting protein 1 isoform X1 n=2 Tax=Egretta garzetta TaxID=188379 RepID=UPI00163C85AE|nr:translin-associated factor X-interacting protein 1 isoform X1 [Egretta garzetta]XP_035754744.1 translin-associated factor X-interacting protein 1 isoform X1 [Egretta garzetta]
MVHVASICIHTDRPKGPQALLHPGGEAPEPYREIFEFFIDNFKTYKPLLSAIKNEYEVTLAHQKRTIRALQPLKATVTTISEECTRQMLALQEKEKDEINKLKQENRRLLKFIDNMKEEKNSLQTQVEHLRTSVAEEYARYLNEHSAHKLLLAKLNEIHNERLDMARHQLQDIKGEDVVKLTLALKMARQDLTTSQVKLNKMTADYGDVVPRRDFESLENKYSDLLREMKTLQKDLNQLRKDHEALLGIQAETTEEQDNLRAELQRVQRNRTPRPNWAKCSEVIPGGAERWGGLAKGKSSDQLVDVLLEEIGTRMLRERDIFPGWGKGDRVPVYLRHEGEVKNKKLTKKDAVNILKDVWKEKMAQEQQTGQRSSLPEFFLSYLQKKHGAAAAIEWSYTLYENMRLCRSNHILSSFYDILTGKVGEEQYHAQNRLVSSLQRELAACDISDSGSLTGEQFSTAVREAFPLKRKESIQELVDASRYKLDSTEDLIDYKSLFKEDEEGNAEPLVAKLRSQYVREKQEYLGQLKDKLGDLTEVSADDLKTAFCTINPTIDDQMLDTYVGLAYQVRRGQPEQEVVPVEMALERLLTGDVRRAGPSPQEGSTASFEGEQGDIQYTRPSPGRGIRVLETKTRQESSSAMAVPKLQSKWCKPKKQNLFFLL